MALLDDFKKIGTFLVTELTVELARKQKKASGALIRSFKSEVSATSTGYEIAVVAASYFKFVDQGVNGTQKNRGSKYSYKNKKPPIQALLDWVRIRSIASGNKEVRSAAFAIQNYIYRNGVKGVNILDEVLRKTADQYTDKIADSMFTEVNVKIDNIIKNGTNI